MAVIPILEALDKKNKSGILFYGFIQSDADSMAAVNSCVFVRRTACPLIETFARLSCLTLSEVEYLTIRLGHI